MTQKSEESRGVWLLRWWSDLAQDLRYAFRGMRRDAAFTAFAILITGLGIGASSTVFSVVNALLLRPLPFRDPGRLVSIANVEWSTQVSNFLDLREQNRSFSDLAGWVYGTGDWQLTGTGEPERVTGVPVTRTFFPCWALNRCWAGRSQRTNAGKEHPFPRPCFSVTASGSGDLLQTPQW